MLHVVVSENKKFRNLKVSEVIAQFGDSELILVDDSSISLLDLEQFLFPSLFSIDVPVVHGKFLLDVNDIEIEFAKKLSASPTIFILEELTIGATSLNTIKKSGALLCLEDKEKSKKPTSDIFEATLCITAKDKKSRWLAYRASIEKHSIESILGILYWKIRTLLAKEKSGNGYEKLYKRMLDAQARSWRTGAPLEVLIEKVILTF